jgi:hypothetical protein
MEQMDIAVYLSQGTEGIDALAEKLKTAIRGARL